MSEKFVVLLFFWGPSVLALIVLLIAGCFAPTEKVLVIFGIIAALLFVAQFLLFLLLKGIGEAWSGDQGSSPVFLYLIGGGMVSLFIYFWLGRFRIGRK